jgi:hypothetical protein
MTRAVLLAVSCSLLGCEPKLVVGERTAPAVATAGSTDMPTTNAGGTAGAPGAGGVGGDVDGAGQAGDAGDAGQGGQAGDAGDQCPDTGVAIPAMTDPIEIPWSTGFENDFCDYQYAGGFCYGGGTRKIVTSPVHSGRYAAEFTVTGADTMSSQERCVRQGVLPSEAYYGAWYYIPALPTLTSSSLWNLWHFSGGDTSTAGLWDVTVVNNTADGNLQLLVYDFLVPTEMRPTNPPPVPIGEWFHIQFYLKRASDQTGVIRLYQNGKLLLEKTKLVTDDSSWGQWYVGNLAKELTPPESTLYVDDVTIGPTGISL